MRDKEGFSVPYYLYPRSSISKTPLIQTNSVGIIDRDYRGNVMGKVLCLISNSSEERVSEYLYISEIPPASNARAGSFLDMASSKTVGTPSNNEGSIKRSAC